MNNNITEDYCSFEVSKLLKEKGYRNITVNYYIYVNGKHSNRNVSSKHIFGENWNSFPSEGNSSRVSCPTHALAIKWIRENFDLHISSVRHPENKYYWTVINKDESVELFSDVHYNSPEEATEAALLYTLKNLI